MDWIPGILKLATVSTKLMLAIFITSIALIVAPNYISQVASIPPQWQWVPVLFGMFSFTMLFLSAVSSAIELARGIPKKVLSFIPRPDPNGLELELLKTIGQECGEEEVDLEDLDYSKVDRLDILAARDSLASKNLISIDSSVSTFVKITKKGRDFIQELKKSQKGALVK